MKKIRILLTVLLVLINLSMFGKKNDIDLKVNKVEGCSNIYSVDRFYLGGQPNLEELRWLKKRGVSKIINLRSDNENEKFLNEAFNESQIADELNLEYISIPIAGVTDYTPEKLDHFISEIINTSDTVLIHCAGAGRVTYFMMAYLIKHEGYTKEEAYSFGKQLTYKSYLDLLLSNE